MRWSDLPLKPSPRTLRQFAGLWIVFFGGLAAWHGLVRGHEQTAIVLALVAATVGPAGLLAPALIRPIFVAWLVIGFPIGWTLTRVFLLAMFFCVMTPVAWVFRLRGRDALHLARPDGQATRWAPKPAPGESASYFRQY
ncbi:MAG TPA: SxtJ family membrane protein [Vicinamibacterales bacterium]|nr:SxtJ family membrane protein [Vicinamibacterales bacterium]